MILRRLGDLKGKHFMAVAQNAFGGWRAALREFQEWGIDPYTEFGSLSFGGTQDSVVYAVLAGKVDAGTIRSGLLERMASQGLIRMDQFFVFPHLDYDDDNTPFVYSTRAYPEWPMARLRHTDDDLAQQVAVALLQMPQNSTPARSAGYAGWGIPLNYQSVHDCLKILKVGPYKDIGRITLAQAIGAFWKSISVGLLMFLIYGRSDRPDFQAKPPAGFF